MTFTRFFSFGGLLWLLLLILRAVFLNWLNLDSIINILFFYVLSMLITMGCVRRIGVINFLEAASVAVLWTIGLLIADYLFAFGLLHIPVFSSNIFWINYLVVLLTIFFFHKKRHVEIRKELEQLHHGHHH